MMEIVRCPMCRASAVVAVQHLSVPFMVVECRYCGIDFLSPRLPEDEMNKFYSNNYYDSTTPLDIGYATYRWDKKFYLSTFRRHWRKIKPYVPTWGRVLDVGAGFGYFLDILPSEYIPEAIEISSEAITELRDKCFGVYDDISQCRSGYYDIVFSNDFLEHTYRPFDTLKEMYRITKPGGVVVTITIDHNCFLRKLSGASWVDYKTPEHVVYWSRNSLHRALEGVGLTVIKTLQAWHTVRLGFVVDRLKKISWLSWLPNPKAFNDIRVVVPSGHQIVIARRGKVLTNV